MEKMLVGLYWAVILSGGLAYVITLRYVYSVNKGLKKVKLDSKREGGGR